MSKLTENQVAYREKFKDPRWQKCRLKILNRDDWACQLFGDKGSTLHVHHRYYTPKTDPWEYPDRAFVTLCEDCHEVETEFIAESVLLLTQTIKEMFFSGDIIELASAFSFNQFHCPPDVLAHIIRVSFQDEKACEIIKKRFFDDLAEKRKKTDV